MSEKTDIIEGKVQEALHSYKLSEKSNFQSVLKFISDIKILLSFIVGCTAMGTLLFAGGKKVASALVEEEVGLMISDSLFTIQEKVDKIEETSNSNKSDIEQIKFEVKQILYITKEIAPRKTVEEVEEKTEIFRPKNRNN